MYRVKNDRGGHDLTPAGWQVMADLQKQFAAITQEIADALQVMPRSDPKVQAVLAQWSLQQITHLQFLATGELPN